MERLVNSRQRSSRYGFALHFVAGATSVILLVTSLVAGVPPFVEYALGASLLVVLILHARMGFALSRLQSEIEIMRRLSARSKEASAAAASNAASALSAPANASLSEKDASTLERVRAAIENGRIDLYLQPIVSLPQRKPRYYEAFSRLRDAEGKVLKPADYLSAAEAANRIGVIDNMILMRCIQALREQRKRAPRLAVFCNLSPATIYDTDFFNQLTDYLEANSDLASNLIFEFTYPAIQTMHPRVEANLSAIARRGFEFSIDHVHSIDLDWESLSARNFRFAKAPSGLLLAAGRGDEASVAKLRAFRKRLSDVGVDLIAEKIEFENHMPEILALGIDFGQGNLFGPARPAEFYLGDDAPEGDRAAA
ncbi:MAG: EAL domain-containing protein [Parvularculaceae bacterium]|nr:EAL domain-containing protein [Parvularculaceae bacterium]